MENRHAEVKAYLRRLKGISDDINVIKAQMENLRLSMLPQGVSYDKDPVQTSPQDPMANFAAKLDELGRELAERQKEYETVFDEISAVICAVKNGDARVILAKRYIGFKCWQDIESEVPYCVRVLHRKHNIGLMEIEKMLGIEKVI